MSFSKLTLEILDRLNQWRAAGDADADRKLAEAIEAAIGGRPLPTYSDVSSDGSTGAAGNLDAMPTLEERRRRAYAKVTAGQPLTAEDENLIIFGLP